MIRMAVKEDEEHTSVLRKCWLPEMNADEDQGRCTARDQVPFVLAIVSDMSCDGITVRPKVGGLRGGALHAILQSYQMKVPTDARNSRMSRGGTSPKEKELSDERTLCNSYLPGYWAGACLVRNL